jgi:hypothetical protein
LPARHQSEHHTSEERDPAAHTAHSDSAERPEQVSTNFLLVIVPSVIPLLCKVTDNKEWRSPNSFHP